MVTYKHVRLSILCNYLDILSSLIGLYPPEFSDVLLSFCFNANLHTRRSIT